MKKKTKAIIKILILSIIFIPFSLAQDIDLKYFVDKMAEKIRDSDIKIGDRVIVWKDELQVYSEPSIDQDITNFILNKGDNVKISDVTEKDEFIWGKIRIEEKSFWIRIKNLRQPYIIIVIPYALTLGYIKEQGIIAEQKIIRLRPPIRPVSSYVRVLVDGLNVRLSPYTNYDLAGFQLFNEMVVPVNQTVENGNYTWSKFFIGDNPHYILRSDAGHVFYEETDGRFTCQLEFPEYEILLNFGVNIIRQNSPILFINKSKRKMYLFIHRGNILQLAKQYRIALGYEPNGPKRRVGDLKTPEGRYYIAGKNPGSNFGRDPDDPKRRLGSLHISYPNAVDAWNGFYDQMITKEQYNEICNQWSHRKKTSQNTILGSFIFIHGGGSEHDWTAGCIALNDRDMKELYQIAQITMPVYILP